MDNGDNSVPLPRSGHVAVVVGKYLLVWGGYTEYVPLPQNNYQVQDVERYLNTETIWAYHTDIHQWLSVRTNGDPPLGTSGASAVAVDEDLYVIGGHTEYSNSNAMYKLTLKDMTWSLVGIQADDCNFSPRDKFAAWVDNDRIFIFGGYGLPYDGYLNSNGNYIDDPTTYSHRGWNNQLFYYDTAKNERKWHNPKCNGACPSPRAAHSVAKIKSQLFLFGGRHCQNRLNDLYVLDLPSFTWTLLDIDGELPPGRSWHSLTTMTPSSLFLYGGYTQNGTPLSDAWMLNLECLKWKKLRVAENKTRLWHTACQSSDGDVLVYGGCCNDILDQNAESGHTSEILVFRCAPRSLLNVCLDAVFAYRQTLESEWETLPRSLEKLLRQRCTGVKSAVVPVDQSPSDTIGFTCCVS